MSRRAAMVVATWFGCGLVPLAPGTAGTLGAIPLYLLLRPHGAVALLLAAVLLIPVGVWAANHVIAKTGLKDPQIVVIDEVIGVLIAWTAAPNTLSGLAFGFVAFRLLDQTKPWPARAFEERLPGGWGVVMDDVAAGVWAALATVAVRALL